MSRTPGPDSTSALPLEVAEQLGAYARQAELPYGEKQPTVNDEGMLPRR